MNRYLITFLCAMLFILPSAYGANKSNTTDSPASFTHVFDGDVAHARGGLWGRFLVFNDWANPAPIAPYETNTVIKHDGALWVTLTVPGAADEPGVSSNWKKITDQPTGSGAEITGGTADPTGGNAGDAYFQIDTNTPIPNVTTLWRNIAGTWTPYNLPTGGSGSVTALTQDQVEDPTDTTIGSVSGQRLGQSIEANSPVEELRGDDLGDADDFDSYTIKTDQGDLFVVHPTQVGHSITFTEYNNLDDVAALWGFSTEHRWRGIHNQNLVLRNRQDNDVFITSSGVFFRTSGAVFRHLAHPDNWKGQWPDETEAENHIDALSQTVQYGNVLAQATLYTAGTITKDWNGYGDDVLETVANAPVYNDGQVIGNPFDEANPLSLALAHHTSATSRTVQFFTDATRTYDSNENFHMNFDRVQLGQRGRLVAVEWEGSWAQDIRYHLEIYKEAPDGTIEAKILTGSEYEPNASPGRPIHRTHRWEISATAHIVVEEDDILQIGVRNTSVGSTNSTQGQLSANSPTWSDDAAEADADFVFLGAGRYPENNPRIGDAPTLLSDTNVVFGNVKIFFSTDVIEVEGNIDLTQAQVEDGTDTDFGLVSGERLGQVLAAYNYAGNYNSARAYRIGQSIRANSHYWIAPTAIVAGVGSPSLVSPHGWALLSREDQYLGHLVTNNSYDLVEANWYRVGHRVFFVIADVAGVTGTNLTAGHANIVELTGHHLTQAQAENENGETFGLVSGERLFQAVAAHGDTDTDTTVEVDGVEAFYTIGTRVLAVQVQQDNGVDVTGTATLPISSQVRFGLAETATDTEAAAVTTDAVVLTPGNLPFVGLESFDNAERLCPDPSTGTTGDVCSRNAAGAYVLTTPSSGGGVVAAADVTLNTDTFDGNLSAPQNVQDLAEEIDEIAFAYDIELDYYEDDREFEIVGYTNVGADLTDTVILPLASAATAGLITTERLCPDPSTGTAGDVCSRNAAGAYVLTTPSTSVGGVTAEGGGYGAWEDIGSRSGAISSIAVTLALNANKDIDDYEELYVHIEANDTNDQRSVSTRFRVSEVPVGADLLVGFPGNNTDEGSILFRRNTDGTELTLDPHGSVINFPATSVTTIYARTLTADEAGGPPDFFLSSVGLSPTAALSVTPVNKLSITAANVVVNRGDFTIETGTNSLNSIQVSEDGTYSVEFSFHLVDVVAGAAVRAEIQADIDVVRAGVEQTDLNSRISRYWRNQVDTDEIYVDGTHTVDLLAGDQIEVRLSVAEASLVTFSIGGEESEISVVKIEAGGGSGTLTTTQQQELVNESRLIDTAIIATTQNLTIAPTSVSLEQVIPTTYNFTTIPIEDFERLDIGLELDGTFDFVVPIRISRQMMLDIPTTPANLYPNGGTTSRRLEAVYWSGRISASTNSEIGTAVTRPLYDWVDSRRGNGVESLSISFTKNIDGDISQMHFYASSDVTMRVVYAVVRRYE